MEFRLFSLNFKIKIQVKWAVSSANTFLGHVRLQASKQVNTQSVSTKNMAMGGKKISFDQSEVLLDPILVVSIIGLGKNKTRFD